mmetsp:Transcript_5883/g.9772  ORF Transcript_5883/g.9772 Transcript_5883/m.9772 type:complete len:148 (+) Transcript_5883:294-737(+)
MNQTLSILFASGWEYSGKWSENKWEGKLRKSGGPSKTFSYKIIKDYVYDHSNFAPDEIAAAKSKVKEYVDAIDGLYFLGAGNFLSSKFRISKLCLKPKNPNVICVVFLARRFGGSPVEWYGFYNKVEKKVSKVGLTLVSNATPKIEL